MTGADNIQEVILIATGLLNLGIAVYSLILVGRARTPDRKARHSKAVLLVAYCMYIGLESNWLTQGLYHVSSWVPILWNLMDCLWMLCIPFITSMRPTHTRIVDQQLQSVLDKTEQAVSHHAD